MDEEWPDLQEYLRQTEQRYEQRFKAMDRALTKAEDVAEKSRELLAIQARDLLPRAEFDAQHKALIDKIERAKDQSTAIIMSVISMVISAGAIIALLVAHK